MAKATSKNETVEKDGKVCIGIDMGTGSLAILARVDDEVVWSRSLILDSTTARLDKRRERRRMILTRLAHRAREYWWNQCARDAGIPVLKTVTKVSIDKYKISHVDDRLKREHPANGDQTVFCGALLRIMILEGQIDKLEGWQIYKAVHDAIQKRGYDRNIPWKTGYEVEGEGEGEQNDSSDDDEENDQIKNKKSSQSKKDDEGDTVKRVDEFMSFLEQNFKDRRHHFACYFDAYKSGLWEPKKGITTKNQDYTAKQRALADWEGYIPPRQMVEAELLLILEQIKKRFPKIDPRHVMFGPSLTAYGSHPKHQQRVAENGGQTGLIPGRPTDWDGVLGQKIPRFDNRAVGNCVLFPRFKVCKSPDKEKLKSMPASDKDDRRELRLHSKFQLLIRLRNLRVLKASGVPEALNPDELRAAYHNFEEKLKYREKELKGWLEAMGFSAAPGANLEAKGAKTSGRGAFSRPALRVICEWIYQGWTTTEARDGIKKQFIKGNTDPLKGLTESDFDWMSKLKPEGWSEAFYVPHRPLDAKFGGSPEKFVESVKYPVVRHRLGLMLGQLKQLKLDLESKGYKLDDARVGVEVISDESKETFLGEKTKRELEKRMKDNAKKNAQVQKLCDEFKLKGFKNFERVKLAMSQGFIDPYDVNAFNKKESDKARMTTMMRGIKEELYDIDHIVPESQGGPDEFYNKILTKKEFNRDHKKGMTPYEYFHARDNWRRFVEVLDQLPFPSADRLGVNNLKRNLMTTPDAVARVSKKTDLQATGYIEKSAQTLVNLVFGWQEAQLEGSKRRIVCVPGSYTARLRSRYQVNELLYSATDLKSEEQNEAGAKKTKKKLSPLKNRANHKHHILDAAVLSFIPEWGLNPHKNKFFALPKWADKDWFNQKVLANHEPKQWNVEKPSLFETRKSLVQIKSGDDITKYVAVKKHIHEKNAPSVEWKIGNLKSAVDEGMFNSPPFSMSKESITPVTKALKEILKNNPKKLPEQVFIEQNGEEIPLKTLKFLVDYSPYRHLVDEDGGVLQSESHRGIIVYRDTSQRRRKWDVAVVAAWSNPEKVKNQILGEVGADKVEFWNGGEVLTRGMVVEVTSDGLKGFTVGRRLIIAQTRENNQIGFVGEKSLVAINPLIESGGIRVVLQ